MEEQLKTLIHQRGIIKGRLTKFESYVKVLQQIHPGNLLKLQISELQFKLSKIELLFTTFDDIQTKIETLSPSKVDDELDERDKIESMFSTLTSIAQEIISSTVDKNKPASLSDAMTSDNDASGPALMSHIKLPTLSLPSFDGNHLKWLEYRDTFESLIHQNKSLPSISKFHYLKSSLEASAAVVIKSIECTSENYQVAWDLLNERYNNKKLLVNNHLKSLFTFEQMNKESYKSLRYLIDHITKNLRALNALDEPTQHWDTLVIFMMASKLDGATCRKWEEYKCTLSMTIKLEDFYHFLRSRADVLETVQFSKCDIKTTDYKKSFNKQTTSLVSSSVNNSNNQCVLCKQHHRLFECQKFKSMTPESRISEVNKLNLCTNCLRPSHHRSNCKLGNCRICGRKHNTLLHIQNYAANASQNYDTNTNEIQITNKQQTTNTNNQQTPKSTNSLPNTNTTKVLQTTTNTKITCLPDSASLSVAMPSQVLLSTALVEIFDPSSNSTHLARALLDSGSQSSFITEKIKNKFNLTTKCNTIAITGINNGTTNVTESCDLLIKSRLSAFNVNVSCMVIPQITGNLPSIRVDPLHLALPSSIQLADPEFYRPSEVDILLGADVFWDLINGNHQIKLGRNKPILRETKLGWVVAGPMGGSHITKGLTAHCNFSQETQQSITKFWEIEEIPASRKLLSADEQFCETHFIKTTKRLSDGRFCVTIPLREIPEEALGDSFTIAKGRYLRLEQRLSRSPQIQQAYKDFIDEYENLGHLTEIKNPPDFAHYIPHHAVLRAQSDTTKLRVVYDASCPTESGKSFNDIQVVGPTVQDDLFSIIIRFRQNPYAVSGDIEKMYRQVMVHPSQRNLQMIFWRDDETNPLKILQLNTVTYGTASAPFLSTRCLVQLAEECSNPIISDTIKHSFYVDDCLITAQSRSELQNIITGVIKQLADGGFPLRKFRTNCPEIFQECDILPKNDNHDFSKQSSVLGLMWSPTTDSLQFSTDINIPQLITKRTILSAASQIFDPLGLLSATIIIPKMLIQKLWLAKSDWDEPVPDHIEKNWTEFAKNIHQLSNIHIARNVALPYPNQVHIHVFTDASQDAYAACLYIKSTDDMGNTNVKLLCAKSKVAPTKPTTIPRLELCGALLGAKLHAKVIESINIKIESSTFWSDSHVVLGWIKTQPKTLKQFVCNRVQEIRELTSQNSWRFVPGVLNPSDLATRGIQPHNLVDASLWWSGPQFLSQSPDNWPSNSFPDVILPEIKTNISVTSEKILNFNNYSKLHKLQRIFAYILRFINNTRKNKTNKIKGILTVNELNTSLITLAQLAQRESFPEEIKMLSSNKCLPSKSHILALNPFLDSQGVLRVGGRLENNPHYNFDKKHPILIHSKHKFTKLLMEYEHLRLLHCGPQHLLSSIREQFWPTGGRDIARKTVSKCVICTRLRGKTLQPIMGNLPQCRINPASPFETCGVDFGGPFYISSRKGRGARTSKCYLCLFVCYSTKALHLEVVSDLSTNAFILCLRRFISRRAKPKSIYCDNGTNFVGANNELKRMLKSCRQSVSEFASDEGIEFLYSPAYSPNFRGTNEAGIKSAKFHLKRIVGNTSLKFAEITTLFCQIEAILNSRPLTPLSADPSDLSPLTPGHFLVGRPLTSLPSPTTEKISINRYQLLERLRQSFWTRWTKEYICELQQRVKWRTKERQLKLGDLVIIKEEHLPPMKWLLGRIVKTYLGSDGTCRVVDVQTCKNVLRRAVSRLCPLPLPEEES